MAVHGFATQAAHNRRQTALYLSLYLVTFFILSLLALGLFPIFWGEVSRSIIVDPLAYLSDFWPFALMLVSGLILWTSVRFRGELRDALKLTPVDERRDRRLVAIAAEQATVQGLRTPRLAVIETPARNAVTVGALGGRPTIAVTRGLLDDLDDDEVAAVLAHEIAHWRVGDVRLLTVNQLLHRTTALLQSANPLRVDRNPQYPVPYHLVLIAVFLPIIVIGVFVGGFLTMTMWRLGRHANERVRAGRDTIADAEAIRVTHFPEALESAIAKCAGHGWFDHAERIESMLFDGATIAEGGTHPAPDERIAMLRRHGGELYMAGRVRRDTRKVPDRPVDPNPAQATRVFGRRDVASAQPSGFGAAIASRPAVAPATTLGTLALLVNPAKFHRHHKDLAEWGIWRQDDRRDWFGVMPDMQIWAYGALVLALSVGIVFANDFGDYVDYTTGRAYFFESDGMFPSAGCTFSNTHDTCSPNLATAPD